MRRCLPQASGIQELEQTSIRLRRDLTHHTDFAAQLVRHVAERQHADDCASEGYAGQRIAVVVLRNLILAVYTG